MLDPDLVKAHTPGALSMCRSPGHAQKSSVPPSSSQKKLSRQPLLSRLQPLPLRALAALTSTVGIGAASSSGVRLPNSSASTSIPPTVKEEVGRMFTSARAAPFKQHAESGVRSPPVSPLRLFTGGASKGSAWSGPNLPRNPEVTEPDVENCTHRCTSEVSPG